MKAIIKNKLGKEGIKKYNFYNPNKFIIQENFWNLERDYAQGHYT